MRDIPEKDNWFFKVTLHKKTGIKTLVNVCRSDFATDDEFHQYIKNLENIIQSQNGKSHPAEQIK